MKREAHGHTKMKRLCKLLDLPLWGAVGILESLWKLTAQEAPQGDIGKLSDEDIALGIDWKGDSGALISALRESRWIDVTDSHRYIIHDWHEHSDDSLDMKLARCGKLYANDYTPRMSKLSKEERAKICTIFAWPGASVFICGTKRHEKALPVTSHLSPVTVPAPEQKHSRSKAAPSAECVKLYAAYPRHVAPDAAYRAITRALSKKPFAELLLAVEGFATQCQRNATEPQFIPHPATWFNQGRYNDEPENDLISRGAPNVRTNANFEVLKASIAERRARSGAHDGSDDAGGEAGQTNPFALLRKAASGAV